jgi:hypothetical protein
MAIESQWFLMDLMLQLSPMHGPWMRGGHESRARNEMPRITMPTTLTLTALLGRGHQSRKMQQAKAFPVLLLPHKHPTSIALYNAKPALFVA